MVFLLFLWGPVLGHSGGFPRVSDEFHDANGSSHYETGPEKLLF
jgi:hypothetical protein